MNNLHVVNNTIKKKCSNCGECCTEFIPLSKLEVEIIKRYLVQHPEIKNQKQMEGNNQHVLCPFRDRVNKCCTIYPVRPIVCKLFLCSIPVNTLSIQRTACFRQAYYNNSMNSRIVSLHTLFFDDVEWELKVLYDMLKAENEEDFVKKLIKLNPVIVNEGRISFSEEEK